VRTTCALLCDDAAPKRVLSARLWRRRGRKGQDLDEVMFGKNR
jgi:hypothetical protein